MLKKLLLAGLLAAVLMLTGCALIEMDEEVDAASVVITMGDKTFTKGEVAAQIETYYGDLSGYDAQYKRDVQENVVNAMIQQNLDITYVDNSHVSIGGNLHSCRL